MNTAMPAVAQYPIKTFEGKRLDSRGKFAIGYTHSDPCDVIVFPDISWMHRAIVTAHTDGELLVPFWDIPRLISDRVRPTKLGRRLRDISAPAGWVTWGRKRPNVGIRMPCLHGGLP